MSTHARFSKAYSRIDRDSRKQRIFKLRHSLTNKFSPSLFVSGHLPEGSSSCCPSKSQPFPKFRNISRRFSSIYSADGAFPYFASPPGSL